MTGCVPRASKLFSSKLRDAAPGFFGAVRSGLRNVLRTDSEKTLDTLPRRTAGRCEDDGAGDDRTCFESFKTTLVEATGCFSRDLFGAFGEGLRNVLRTDSEKTLDTLPRCTAGRCEDDGAR